MSIFYFKINFFENFFYFHTSECQTAWIQIRGPNCLQRLIAADTSMQRFKSTFCLVLVEFFLRNKYKIQSTRVCIQCNYGMKSRKKTHVVKSLFIRLTSAHENFAFKSLKPSVFFIVQWQIECEDKPAQMCRLARTFVARTHKVWM